MSDEGFHEIQLNGKQLVFLFMATTVVLVLTFLFGVIVGRNARAGTTEAASVAPADVAPDPAVSPVPDNPAPAPVRGAAAPMETAPKASEELSYADRLLRDAAPEENLKPPTSAKPATSAPPKPAAAAPSREAAAPPREPIASREKPVVSREKPAVEHAPVVQEPVAANPPAPRPAPATPPPTPAEAATPVATAASSSDPSGPGFAVQVAAFRDRRDSDTLAKQLIAKGYPAFVMDPVKGAPTAMFRVRVGKYKTLKDAQAIMAKLQTAEQFNAAWIAR
ncbi:MAG TPA: SPOR domain-containing protein [Vicinamibacterales bacterium]|jgi:DedD protein|nr:SPOR domain-containing protein [Vicinamibacterales bacterium]